MANRRQQMNTGGRRMDYGRSNDRGKNFGGRTPAPVSPWQGNAAPTAGLTSLLPLGGNSTEATLALANNLISNLLQQRQSTVPSLLDMPPIRRDFGGNMDVPRYDRNYAPQRMGNQGNFRRPGNYGNNNRDRNSNNRRPFRPNDGNRQANKTTPRKDSDNKAKAAKSTTTPKKDVEKEKEVKAEAKEVETQQTEEKGSEKEKKEDSKARTEKKKTPYDDINQNFLKCHICNKSMWDGRSFENHINGRAHAIMMQKTAESYALTADTMRQELKIREMKRTRRSGKQSSRDFYCAMCDMYAAEGAAHRTTAGHRKLKKYLHPNCSACHKEMPTRIELDEHRLTPEHIMNISQKTDSNKPKTEIMVISTIVAEQSYVRQDRNQRMKRAPTAADEDKVEEQDGEAKEKTDTGAEGDIEIKEPSEIKTENGVEEEEQKLVLDYKEGDDMSQVTAEMIPHYSTERPVARSFLNEFKCIQCTLCKRLLDNEETAEVHLKTWRHHLSFVRLIKEKAGLLKKDERKRRADGDDVEDANAKKVKTEGNQEQDEDAAELVEDTTMEEDGHDNDEEHDNDETGEENGHDEDNMLGEPSPGAVLGEGEGEWETAVDEILNDEGEVKAEELQDNGEDVQEVKEEEEPPVEKEVAAPKTRPSPRGRGRGRGRRRT